MKDKMQSSPSLSSVHHQNLVLDYPEDEYSLMFPPSPEHSPSGSSCNSWGSQTPSIKSPSSTGDSTPDSKRNKWVRKEKIGQGAGVADECIIFCSAQGSIYRCEESKTGREVAVKVIWTKELPPPAVEAVKREVKTMKRLRHKHLVRYLQATEKKQSELRIYMEYAAGGSLSSRLSRSGALPLPLVKRYTRQLCEALQYLHQNGIAHRDIKCANILLTAPKGGDERADVKLADFGTFKVIGCASLVGGLKGTPHWMAPEVIRQQNMEDGDSHERWFRADVWSLGCTMLEMITGRSPWQQYSNPLTAMYQIVSSENTPTIPADVSDETASFLKLCLQRNPEHRATITQLLAHPFVRVNASTRTKVKSSKHRIKYLDDGQPGSLSPECNQKTSQLSPSTPKTTTLSIRKDLALEPHEDSTTLSHMESHGKLILTPMSPQPPPNSPAIHYVRQNVLGSPDTQSPAKLALPRTPRMQPENFAIIALNAKNDNLEYPKGFGSRAS
ncbi:STE/STE11 protein kinase [Phytophthora megakarya]|uniref:STE/STE11 protein kinase n=1 Tax=Phytophthora megakarya TaxID=4795 RepID=A0A225WMK4_9STRA|nr:STE/STE11 protein kinase [Phytophthora megakarya]